MMRRPITLCTVLVRVMVALMVAGHNAGSAGAGIATPNVAGKWEGTWKHRAGSGQITLQLTQEGTKVLGKQSLPGVIPLFGSRRGQPIALGQEVREGHLEDSTLIFYVRADVPRRRVNFTLTVIEESMTGTACGDTCATLKLKKAPF
jgi:hypothetical protein